jgi:hypothetical protein
MAGSGVVPCIRAFLGLTAQNFVDHYFQAGIKFFQDHRQRNAHDARTDKNDVGIAGGWNGCGHGISPPGHLAVAT